MSEENVNHQIFDILIDLKLLEILLRGEENIDLSEIDKNISETNMLYDQLLEVDKYIGGIELMLELLILELNSL